LNKIDTHIPYNPYTEGLLYPVLVDADIVAYSASFSKGVHSEESAKEQVDKVIEYIKNGTSTIDIGQYSYFLTGKGNFRYDIVDDYKANRKNSNKPEYIGFVRDYIIDQYNAVVTEGQEADDAIGIMATELNYKCIIASVDKDFLQIPCWHYNTRRNEWYKPDEFEGLQHFYKQVLTGDTVDNIKGIYKVGPKTAEKMLDGCTTEQELYEACVKAYNGSHEKVLENGRLLWLRRYKDELWSYK